MRITEQTPDRILLEETTSYRMLWKTVTTCTLDRHGDELLVEERRGQSTRRAQYPLHDVIGAAVENSGYAQEATDVIRSRCVLYLRGAESVALGSWTRQRRELAWIAASIRIFLGVGRRPQQPEGVVDPDTPGLDNSTARMKENVATLRGAMERIPQNNPLASLFNNELKALSALGEKPEDPEIVALRERVREHADDVNAQVQLASLLHLLGQPASAQETLEQAIQLVNAQGTTQRGEELKDVLHQWIVG